MKKVADVILPLPLYSYFTYALPDEWVDEVPVSYTQLANATLTEGQISFVNSALGNLDELVTVEKVEQFKGSAT